MPRYKRNAAEAELDVPQDAGLSEEQLGSRTKLRNMWEFASFMQYIFMFGHVVKIEDDFDMEDLEDECLKAESSTRLARMGLQMLKYVSSHRGLTPEIFDEYTRRQYTAKAPQRNPYGEEEEPRHFADFDVYTKIRVLQQLSTWTFGNADRIRGLMPSDDDHLSWRIDPLGWDKEDRTYFVLDDNRLYRREDVPLPPPTPPMKAKSRSTPKKKKGGKSKATRSSKRRKVEETPEPEEDEEAEPDAGAGTMADDTVMTNGDYAAQPEEESGYGFTDKTWSCIAVELDEYQNFLATIFRSRDPNEKALSKRIEQDVLPILEKREEARKAKQQKRLREMENLQKMATAKRSGRLAAKQETERQEREAKEAEERKQAELRMAHEEQDRQRRIEEGHESRRLTREQRVKEREVKRILMEEELAKMEEDAERAASQDPNTSITTEGEEAKAESKRLSERHLKTKREQHKKELERLAEEEDKWYFDCSGCGVHGENIDDGSHSIACEKCGVWQHSKCHGLTKQQSERENFHFVCNTCKRKEEDAKKPKIPSLKLGKNRASSGSPVAERKSESRPATAQGNGTPRGSGLPEHVQRQLDGVYVPPYQSAHSPGPFGQITNGPSLSPQGQRPAQLAQGVYYPLAGYAQQRPPQQQQQRPPQQSWQGSPLPPPARPGSSGDAGSPPAAQLQIGYIPQGHQQQHHTVHQNAIANAGGHPAYQQQPNGMQTFGYNPRAGGTGAMYPMSSLPPSQQQWVPRPSQPQAQGHAMPQYHQPQPSPSTDHRPSQPIQQGYGAPQQQHPPGSGYSVTQQAALMNGFPNRQQQQQQQPPIQQQSRSAQLINGMRSPNKHQANVAPTQQQTQTNGQFQQQPAGLPPMAPSPKANFPPPANSYQHHAGQSPLKSSPPRPAVQAPTTQSPKASLPPPTNTYHQLQAGQSPMKSSPPPRYQQPQQPAQPPPHLAQTPQAFRPPSANGYQQPNLQTPQMQAHQPNSISPATANANGVAADGMSGPWPADSKAIPQKHDQSPAPPSSSQSVGEHKIMPPVAPLAPSPSQQALGAGSIPVKKMPEVLPEAQGTPSGGSQQ